MTKRVVQVGSYSRVVELITVEFVCQHCGQPQSYTMYPGPTPKWCFACYRDVRREQARLRKQRQRARQQADRPPAGAHTQG
jgi:hypothetical protein